ncbi:hypothetical protein AB0392_06015 [Nonomuraea angiospora]|uniref:hypothetical protein n=1 Tax=Nonomuraea angiospora TaxID=46172 RepID=UPI00344BEEFC
MNPLKLSPPQWRVLRYLAIYSATATRVGFRAPKLRDLTGASPEDLSGLADLGHVTGRLHGTGDAPLRSIVITARAHPKLRIHLTSAGKNAAAPIDAAFRALRHLRTHAPLPVVELQDDVGVGDDTLTELEALGFIEITPICPECHEPAQHDEPSSWTPAWGRPPSWSHLGGEPLCPVVGASGYEPATPTPKDRQIVLTSFGRRYAEPYTRQDQS